MPLCFQKSAQVGLWNQKTQADRLRIESVALIWFRHPANGLETAWGLVLISINRDCAPMEKQAASQGRPGSENLTRQRFYQNPVRGDGAFRHQGGATKKPTREIPMAHLMNYQAHFPLWAIYLHAIISEIK